MIINHNLMAMNTYNKLTSNNAAASKSLEKLSSGLRINRAGDDAAGLAISEKMRGQIRGLDQASSNAQNSISLLQTAEGALIETHSILQRMRELAVQSSNDTNTDSDRNEIQKEINQLTSEIDRIADTTEFNTKTLMKGDYGTKVTSASTNLKIKTALDVSDTIVAGSASVAMTGARTAKYAYASVAATGVTITAGTNDTLMVNGKSITLSAGTWNSTQLASKINEYSSEIGFSVDGSGNRLTFTAAKAGNQGTLSILGNASSTVASAVASTTNGIDAAISTIGGVAVTAVADGTDGSIVTVTSGAYKGLVVKVDQVATTSASVKLDVSKDRLTMQIGANEGQTIDINVQDMGAASLGVDAIDVSSATAASASITTIDAAITRVSAERSKLGAYSNRLEHTINNLGTSSENMSAAESRIRDVDMAKEMMNYQKTSILQQAATSMLAQANQQPQNVLKLLQ